MRKTLFSLIFSFVLFLAVPAFAQHGHGSAGGGHSNGGSHGNSGGQRGGGEQHGNPQPHGGGPVRGGGGEQHGGNNVYHGGNSNGGYRGGNNGYHGDRDRWGHNYDRRDFGRDHWTRFGRGDGRWYGGRREYFFGGFWFYSGGWPGWFYNCNTYFDIGPDGYWYAYCSDNPGLYFRVYID